MRRRIAEKEKIYFEDSILFVQISYAENTGGGNNLSTCFCGHSSKQIFVLSFASNFSSMNILASIFLFYFICCSYVVGEVINVRNKFVNKEITPLSKPFMLNARIYRSSIDRFVDNLFHETDTNEDGMVSFNEAYVGCLLLYVQLNRRAPIPPPNREKFLRIFLQAADKNRSNELNLLDKEEYRHVLRKTVGRAILRLTSHKLVTLIGAPLLTEIIVRSIAKNMDGFEAIMRYTLPAKFHDAVIPTVTSTSFLRGFWMLVLVTTLGNACLAAVTMLLDLTLPKTQAVN